MEGQGHWCLSGRRDRDRSFSGGIGKQSRPKAAQHSRKSFGKLIHVFPLVFGQHGLTTSDPGLRHTLHQRTVGYLDKSSKIDVRCTRTSFCDVGRDRHRCSSHLTGQTKPFRVGEACRHGVNQISKLDRDLPYLQFFKTEHHRHPLDLRHVLEPTTANALHPWPSALGDPYFVLLECTSTPRGWLPMRWMAASSRRPMSSNLLSSNLRPIVITLS